MDSILIQKDLFVGVLELNSIVNNQKKYSESIIKSVISNFGFVKNELDTSFLNLKIIAGSTANKVSIKAGTLIDANLKQIIVSQDVIDVYTIPNDSNDHYLTISSNSIVIESGTITITTSGELTGVNTEFTKFRAGNYATKIMFMSGDNTGQYEISSVTSDTVAQLAGSNFTAGTGLSYKIVGTFSQGITATNPNLYYYDSYIITDTTSAPTESDTLFLLAKVSFNGSLTITDLRTQFLKLNIAAVYDYLSAANNLSELVNKITARINLEVYSITEITNFLALKLTKASNLSDLGNRTVARANLEVTSTADMDTALNLKADITDVTNALDLKADIDTGGWHSCASEGGFNCYITYMRDAFGHLHIFGTSESHSPATSSTPFRIPVAYTTSITEFITIDRQYGEIFSIKFNGTVATFSSTTPVEAGKVYSFNVIIPLT